MAAHTYIVDSGNATRRLKTCFVVDSGNVTRRVKKIWVVDSGNVSRLVYVNLITFTLVAGQHVVGPATTTGYSVPAAIGSLTPTTDAEGNAVSYIDYIQPALTMNFGLTIASDPGINYFQTLAFSGTGGSYTASAATYAYSGGVAQWQWGTGGTNFLTNGSSYTVTLTY